MSLTEIRVAGFGGQGVILSAMIVGKAVALYENAFATMTQNFGPEARGGACSAQVLLSDEPILYPYITQPDVLIAMSQEAYDKFQDEVRPGGTILVEKDLVHLSKVKEGVRVYGIPATRIAEELGKKMVLNVVMLGFFCAVTRLVGKESFEKAVVATVPGSAVELNRKAFQAGCEFGEKARQVAGGATREYREVAPREFHKE
jgi:2-oxoglutarate ferredoxin oxidoreductase subunit gamma